VAEDSNEDRARARSEAIRKAVGSGLNRWQSARDGGPGPDSGDAEPGSTDEALAHIEALMNSPLGKTWLGGDVISDEVVQMPPAGTPGIVAPLPRRRRIGSPLDQTQAVPPMMRSVEFKVSALAAVLRIFVWYAAILKYSWLVTWDSIRGHSSIEQRAVRLRETLEGLGPTFIKLGQQLALRADILPYAYCAELGKLLDAVPPFPTEQAIETIESVTGKPLGETFAIFDPNPIGSASLSCVFQALLHDGRKVAIKVRRPGIERVLSADLKAMDWMLVIAEALTLQKPGSTKGMRHDMRAMLIEELNFYSEARSTDLFKRRAEEMKANVATAPKVFFEYSGENVLVTEFVSGVFLYEILNAIDRNDEVALDELRQRGYDPKRIASNLMLAFNWETLEGLLFHADPHPANIVVKPNNTLVFIDFGSCGRASSKTRRVYTQFYNHIVREDVGAMVDSSLAMLEPLPPIDIDAFSKELEGVYWDWLYALKSDHAEWWEKATGIVWMRITEISQKYQIPMNLDTLRQFRATFLYDTLIYRLHDGLDFDREMLKYFKRVGKRARQEVNASLAKRLQGGLQDTDYLVFQEAMRMISQMSMTLQRFFDKPRHNFSALVDKAAYSFTMVIQLVAIFAFVHASSIFGHWLYGTITGIDASVTATASAFLSQPLFQVFLYVILLLVLRKILLRLGDVDIRK
jgi:ubiquinone biosynthesis protein